MLESCSKAVFYKNHSHTSATLFGSKDICKCNVESTGIVGFLRPTQYGGWPETDSEWSELAIM